MTESLRTLLLVRHGRTAWNAEGRAQGQADVPLDEVGLEQARHLATALSRHEGALLWSSDLARASQTAALVADGLGVEVRYDKRLREFEVGEREGLTLAEYADRHGLKLVEMIGYLDGPTPEGGETFHEVARRMAAAFDDVIASLAPGETGIVVTHGAALRVGLLALLGWPDEQVRQLAPVRNCHWVEVRINVSGEAVLVAYNTSGGPDFTCGAGVR